jgi:murein DD-endopeptidase MepM/ murein hydrolase activator NlpD
MSKPIYKDIKIGNPFKGMINKYVPQGHITQYLYENVDLYKSANIGLTAGHNGIDIVFPYGTPVYAVEGGLVVEVKNDAGGYGKHIRILSDNTDIKGGREWTYGHNSENFVKVGDLVKTGQHIANTGNTGFVVSSVLDTAFGFWDKGGNKYNGTHLHLGCREFKYDKKGWRYYANTPKITILNYDNGLLGCVDFTSFFQDTPYGDMEILKRELEKYGEESWYIKFIRTLRFFGH